MRLSEPVDYSQHGHEASAAGLTKDDKGDISTVAIDDLHIKNVGLLKIDAQGSDLRVLIGARQTIDLYRPALIFETERELSAQQGDGEEQYCDFLNRLNYHFTNIGRDVLGLPLEHPSLAKNAP